MSLSSLASKDYSDYKGAVDKVAAQENADAVLSEEIKLKTFQLVIEELFEVRFKESKYLEKIWQPNQAQTQQIEK